MQFLSTGNKLMGFQFRLIVQIPLQARKFLFDVKTIILIVDVNSEIGAQVWSEIGNLMFLRL